MSTDPAAADSRTSQSPFAQLLAQRYSCRGYLPQAVPRETIESILEVAQRSPSWCNSQPWQVVVTARAATDRLREALFERARGGEEGYDIPPPAEYRGVYRERRRECGFGLYASVGIAHGDRRASAEQASENFRLFGAPHFALVTTEAPLGAYGAVDCGAFVNNFMLAARERGVASIAQAAVSGFSKFLRDWFEIAEGRHVVCGISFGFEDPAHPANRYRTTRAPINEVLRWVES